MPENLSFSVNGTERIPPVELDKSLGELLAYLRDHYNSRNECISSIRVDDQEMSEREEAAISLLPLTDLRKIEITLSHPRELAEETLQSLIPFGYQLRMISERASQRIAAGENPSIELARLFDGMQVFGDAIQGAKKTLGITELDSVRVLEIDLLSIMQDLLEAYSRVKPTAEGSPDQTYLVELLQTHLPENLLQWEKKGIPSLISARDS